MTLNRTVIIVIIGLAGVGAMLLPGNFARMQHYEKNRQKLLLYSGDAVTLKPGGSIAQEFTAVYPGLSQIDVLFNGPPSAAESQIRLYLRPSCNAATAIFAATLRLSAQTGPTFLSFPLQQQLDDSAGQTYCLVLEPSSGSAVSLPLSSGDLYPHGQLHIYQPLTDKKSPEKSTSPRTDRPYKIFLPIISNGVQENYSPNADIGFVLHYDGLVWPMAQVFFQRLTANKPYFWGNPAYYVGLVVAYVVLLAGLAVAARKVIR